MFKRKLLISLFLALTLLLVIHQTASASEGIVEIDSTTGSNNRCFATAVFMPDNQYHLLLTCRNLIYPPEDTILYYIAWVTTPDNKINKVGVLNYGKLESKVNGDFINLFVTKEADPQARQPTGSVVMQGNLQSISFLSGAESQMEKPTETTAQETKTPKQTVQIPTVKQSRLEAIFKGSLVLPIIGFFGLIFLLLFLIRRRE